MIPDVSPLLSFLFLAAVVFGFALLGMVVGALVSWTGRRERRKREQAEIQRARAALARLHAEQATLSEATRARHLARIRAEARHVNGKDVA